MANNNTTYQDGLTTNSKSKAHYAIKILENFRNYIVYSNGTVMNCKTGNFLNEKSTKAGYRTVSMRDDNGVRKTFSVHKLMYETFISEVPQGMQINHIDENKTNNVILFNNEGKVCYSNLELVTPKENCNHGSRNMRISAHCTGKQKTHNQFKVVVTNFKTGEVIEEHFTRIKDLCDAHPSQNRLTWYYRLNKKKYLQPLYPVVEGETLLQIYPLNEEYTNKLKGEQD